MVSYGAASSSLPDPHELRSCGASDGELRRCLLTPNQPAYGIAAVFSVTNCDVARFYRCRQARRSLVPVVKHSKEHSSNGRVDRIQPGRGPVAADAESRRYWYNLHLVLVVAQHARLESWPVLTGLRDAFLRIADRTGHAVARLSVMLNHLHAALRAEADTAPLEIAFCYQNNLAHLLRL